MDKGDDILDKTWDILDQWEDKRPPRRLKHSIMKRVRPEKKYYLPFHLSPVYSMLIILVLVIMGVSYLKFDSTKEYNQHVPDTRMASREDSVEITSPDIIAKLEIIENIDMLKVLDQLENIDHLSITPEDDQSSIILVRGSV